MKSLSKFEIASYSIIMLVNIIGIILYYTNPEFFLKAYVIEDGIVEYLTAVFLLFTAFVAFGRLFTIKQKKWFFYVTTFMMFAVFIFGAGEEISWGQRIFGWQTSAEYAAMNTQGETNIHNLMWGDSKVNKLLFSGLMYGSLTVFLVLIPFLHSKVKKIGSFFDNWGVVVPKYHHGLFYLIALGLVATITNSKQWELMEFSFSFILFMVALRPKNYHIFK